MRFEDILNAVNAGRAGDANGIPIPFPKLRPHFPNIQKSVYYLLGGATKSAKTSLTDEMFLFGSLDYRMSNPDNFELDIDYFSFEIDGVSKSAKMIARQMWYDFGLLIDVNTILSRGDHYCSDEIYEIVKGYADYFEKIQDYLTVIQENINPTGVYKYLLNKAEQRGEIIRKNVNKDPDGDPIWTFDKYIPKNPNLYWIVILDHISIQNLERSFTLKQNIDKMSQYFVILL